ncbi:hypothetical protein EMCRGX_G024487, partial [Ephydatia muelleri]
IEKEAGVRTGEWAGGNGCVDTSYSYIPCPTLLSLLTNLLTPFCLPHLSRHTSTLLSHLLFSHTTPTSSLIIPSTLSSSPCHPPLSFPLQFHSSIISSHTISTLFLALSTHTSFTAHSNLAILILSIFLN